RYGDGCDQPFVKAEPLEEQLVAWLADFQPDDALRALVGAEVQRASRREGVSELRRRELSGQLERLRDLYVIGDLTKGEYILRRQAIEEELERTGPPLDPQLDEAGRSSAASATSGRSSPPLRPAPRARQVLRPRLARRRRHRRRHAARTLPAL